MRGADKKESYAGIGVSLDNGLFSADLNVLVATLGCLEGKADVGPDRVALSANANMWII